MCVYVSSILTAINQIKVQTFLKTTNTDEKYWLGVMGANVHYLLVVIGQLCFVHCNEPQISYSKYIY